MNVLLTLNVVVLALFAWLSVVKIVPACGVSLFRYRLWRLRDELVDAMRRGHFDDDEQPTVLVSMVEAAIERAHELSALNLVLLRLSARGIDTPELPLDLDRLTGRDRADLEERLDDFARATVTKALVGSPSGWLTCIVFLPFAIVIALIAAVSPKARGRGRSTGETRFPVVEKLERSSLQALMTGPKDPSGRSLYQHV